MCISFWPASAYIDNAYGSVSAGRGKWPIMARAKAVCSLGVWELIPLAMMMIYHTFISKTSNSSGSGSRQAREEPKKRKIIYIQFPR